MLKGWKEPLKSLITKYAESFLLIGTILLTILILFLVVPKAPPLMTTSKKITNAQKTLHFTAIGDSLTEGVGDTTDGGGFVGYLKADLLNDSNFGKVEATNFGKKGDTTRQIIDRIQSSKESQEQLKKAQFITLTTGGNDLIHAITAEFSKKPTLESFLPYKKQYQEDLVDLYELLRDYNTSAPIYHMGIYNPVHLSFKEMSLFNQVVTDWDDATKDSLTDQENSYFIEINSVLSNGLPTSESTDETMALQNNTTDQSPLSSADQPNRLISDEDKFHPNSLGYQLIAKEFKESILKSNPRWRGK